MTILKTLIQSGGGTDPMKPSNLQVLLEKVLISAELFLEDKGRNEIVCYDLFLFIVEEVFCVWNINEEIIKS